MEQFNAEKDICIKIMSKWKGIYNFLKFHRQISSSTEMLIAKWIVHLIP